MEPVSSIAETARFRGELKEARRLLDKLKSFDWITDDDHRSIKTCIKRIDKELEDISIDIERRRN